MITAEELKEIGRNLASSGFDELYQYDSKNEYWACNTPVQTMDAIRDFIDIHSKRWAECAPLAEIEVIGYKCLVSSEVQVRRDCQPRALTVMDIGTCRLVFDVDFRDFI